MVNAKIEGILMEKVASKSNEGKEKFELRVFQKGNKDLVNVKATQNTFNKVEEGKPVAIPCKISAYQFDGNFGQSVMELF